MSTEDITESYNKRTRHKYSNKRLDADYLKEFVYIDIIPDGLVKQYLKKVLNDPVNKVYRITSNVLKSCFMNEALIHFDKAVYNWSAFKSLISRGMWSWAYVTLYYAQFYCICSMMSLQGTSFARPSFIINGNDKDVQFHVYPEDYENGIFIAEQRKLGKPHQDMWSQYYLTFKDFRYRLKTFKDLYCHDMDHPHEFTAMRNSLNYNLETKLIEYYSSNEEISEIISIMKTNVFQREKHAISYSYYEYIASLRIKLLNTYLNNVFDNNAYYDKLKYDRRRLDMLLKTKDTTCIVDIYKDWCNF